MYYFDIDYMGSIIQGYTGYDCLEDLQEEANEMIDDLAAEYIENGCEDIYKEDFEIIVGEE